MEKKFEAQFELRFALLVMHFLWIRVFHEPKWETCFQDYFPGCKQFPEQRL